MRGKWKDYNLAVLLLGSPYHMSSPVDYGILLIWKNILVTMLKVVVGIRRNAEVSSDCAMILIKRG